MKNKIGYAEKIVRFLKRNSGWHAQYDLQKRFRISKSYLSDILSRLEKEGRISRAAGDGNTKKVKAADTDLDGGFFTIGLLKSSEYIPLVAAMRSITSTNRHLKIRFYSRIEDIFTDMDSGSIDGCCSPLVSAITNFMVRRSFRILFGISSGGSSILYNRDSTGPGILTSENSSMSMLSAKFSDSELKHLISFSDPSEGIKRFLNGDCMYISIWEPYSTILKQKGYREILDYESALGKQPCCVLAFSNRFLGTIDSATARSLQEKYLESNYMKNNLGQEIMRFSRSLGIQTDLVRKSLESYEFGPIIITRDIIARTGFNISEDLLSDLIFSSPDPA